MQNRESRFGDTGKVKKRSFFLSVVIHCMASVFLIFSSVNMKRKNDVFIVQIVDIPGIMQVINTPVGENYKTEEKKEAKKEVKEKYQEETKSSSGKKITSKGLSPSSKTSSFNVDEYKKELLSKISGGEGSKFNTKSSSNKSNVNQNLSREDDTSTLLSTSVNLENLRISGDIPSWYISLLKNKIEENWNFGNIIGELSVIISFRIYKNGEISNLRIEKSSGYKPFDRSAESAIKSTKDIPPFPEEIKEEYLEVTIEFKKEG